MELPELINTVEQVATNPLDRVGAAVVRSRELSALGDKLVVHFVDAARASGASWADIGFQLGVTKQAAQQRFVTRSDLQLERWTDRAKRALGEAQRAAQRLGHTWLGTEHLLLGVLAVPESVGARALTALGMEPEPTEEQAVAKVGGAGPAPVADLVPFTPRAKKVLEATVQHALDMGHNYVGAEHLVLALLAEADGVAAQVMAAAGVTEEALRRQVVTLLTGRPAS